MNLYWLNDGDDEYGMYVFAETLNKAKSLAVRSWYTCDEPRYTDMRGWRIKRDTGGAPEACDEDCERLAALGIHYMTEEEMEAREL